MRFKNICKYLTAFCYQFSETVIKTKWSRSKSNFVFILNSIAWEGRLLVVGFAGGEIPQIPANLLLLKNASAVGLYWGRYMAENPQLLQYVLVLSC